MASHKRKMLIVLSAAVSLALLFFLCSSLEWSLFFHELSRTNWLYFPLLFLWFLLMINLRALRWRYLLPQSHSPAHRDLVDAIFLGFFASFVLPLRAGEFIRPWVLSRWGRVSFSAAFASIVTERVCDVISLLAILALAIEQVPSVPNWVSLGAKSLGVLAAVILVGITACYLWSRQFMSLIQWGLRRVCGNASDEFHQKVHAFFEEFFLGLRAVENVAQLGKIFFLSAALWICTGFWYQLALWSFSADAGFWQGQLVSVLIGVAVAAPSAPGFLGTFELGCVAALAYTKIHSQEFAIAYAIVTHMLQVVMIVACGIWTLRLRRLSFAELSASAEENA